MSHHKSLTVSFAAVSAPREQERTQKESVSESKPLSLIDIHMHILLLLIE